MLKIWAGEELHQKFKIAEVSVWSAVPWSDDCHLAGLSDGRILVHTESGISNTYSNHKRSVRSIAVVDINGVDFISSGNDGYIILTDNV